MCPLICTSSCDPTRLSSPASLAARCGHVTDVWPKGQELAMHPSYRSEVGPELPGRGDTENTRVEPGRHSGNGLGGWGQSQEWRVRSSGTRDGAPLPPRSWDRGRSGFSLRFVRRNQPAHTLTGLLASRPVRRPIPAAVTHTHTPHPRPVGRLRRPQGHRGAPAPAICAQPHPQADGTESGPPNG